MGLTTKLVFAVTLVGAVVQIGSWTLYRDESLAQVLVPALQEASGHIWQSDGRTLVLHAPAEERIPSGARPLSGYFTDQGYRLAEATEGRTRLWMDVDLLHENPLFSYLKVSWGGDSVCGIHSEVYPLWWTPRGWIAPLGFWDSGPGTQAYRLLDWLVPMDEP